MNLSSIKSSHGEISYMGTLPNIKSNNKPDSVEILYSVKNDSIFKMYI